MVGYLTTDENGEFTGTIQGLSAGTYILTAEFEGDSNYNPSSKTKYINVISSSIELSLITSAQIIEVGDTITITATLTKDELPFVNEEVTYKIVTTGGATSNSDFTNNAGQITFSYTGIGDGEIEIIATYGSLEESCEIIDAKMYSDNSEIHNWSTSSLSDSVNYNSSYTMQNGETAYFKVSSLPTKYVFGFVQGSSYCQLQKNGNNIYLYVNGQSAPSVTGSLTTNDIIKFEKVSDTEQKIYINNNLIATISNHSMTAPQPMIRVYNNDSFTMEYIYVI